MTRLAFPGKCSPGSAPPVSFARKPSPSSEASARVPMPRLVWWKKVRRVMAWKYWRTGSMCQFSARKPRITRINQTKQTFLLSYPCYPCDPWLLSSLGNHFIQIQQDVADRGPRRQLADVDVRRPRRFAGAHQFLRRRRVLLVALQLLVVDLQQHAQLARLRLARRTQAEGEHQPLHR